LANNRIIRSDHSGESAEQEATKSEADIRKFNRCYALVSVSLQEIKIKMP
jgi:hypothetical protein